VACAIQDGDPLAAPEAQDVPRVMRLGVAQHEPQFATFFGRQIETVHDGI